MTNGSGTLRLCVLRPGARWRRRGRGVWAAAGEGTGVGGRGVLADPLVLPGLAIPLGVAARLVDRGELAGDLLPVPGPAARHLIGADVDLPLRPGPPYPAVGAGVLEREALGRQVLGVAHVDDRVPVGLRVGLGLVEDRVHGGAGRRGPPAQQPRPLERVARQRAQPDHPPESPSPVLPPLVSPAPESLALTPSSSASSSSPTASTRTMG